MNIGEMYASHLTLNNKQSINHYIRRALYMLVLSRFM